MRIGFTPIGFLALEDGREAALNPLEGGGESVALIDAADLGFGFAGVGVNGEELIRRHSVCLLAVDDAVLAEDFQAGVEGKNGVADPGFFQNLRAIGVAGHGVRAVRRETKFPVRITTMQPATLYQRNEAAPVKWSAKMAASPARTPMKAPLAPTLGK